MLKSFSFVLFLLSSFIARPALAQTKSYKTDTVLQNCLSKNFTTVGMTGCTKAALDDWDKELNKYYKLLLTKLNTDNQKYFKDAQRQWIVYKDKEMKYLSETFGRMDGTMWGLFILNRKLELTRHRATELIDYYETLNQH